VPISHEATARQVYEANTSIANGRETKKRFDDRHVLQACKFVLTIERLYRVHHRNDGGLQALRALDRQIDWQRCFRLDPVAEPAERADGWAIPFPWPAVLADRDDRRGAARDDGGVAAAGGASTPSELDRCPGKDRGAPRAALMRPRAKPCPCPARSAATRAS
jgi:hypothetical protein